MASCRGESLRTCAPTPIVCPNSLRLWLDLALSLGAAGNPASGDRTGPPSGWAICPSGGTSQPIVVRSGEWLWEPMVVVSCRCRGHSLSSSWSVIRGDRSLRPVVVATSSLSSSSQSSPASLCRRRHRHSSLSS